MIGFLLSATRRVTQFWDDQFKLPPRPEIALSLTGHFEERFTGYDDNGFAMFDLVEVQRFGLSRRDAAGCHRVTCRNKQRRGAVVELVWSM